MMIVDLAAVSSNSNSQVLVTSVAVPRGAPSAPGGGDGGVGDHRRRIFEHTLTTSWHRKMGNVLEPLFLY